ncbi:MAG: Transposase [Parcubacteria bacterium 32_520]|nr:MAG: Transposase [Parcubacteria bacterium 32_520]
MIKQVFDKSKSKAGWRTIQMKLKNKGIKMNHKKIQRIKKKYCMITKIRRINPYRAIMKKTNEHKIFENKLNRDFKQNTPFKVFCTDITYLPYNGRIAYLSVIKDISSREIISWNMSQHLEMDIVMNTLEKMKNNPAILSLENILFHSDQGFQYTNPLYINSVKEMNMIQSMSRKGNCIDNAPMESFFGHFKDDVDYKNCKTYEELKTLVDEYMNYYNNERYQWGIQKMTPVEYRNHLLLI